MSTPSTEQRETPQDRPSLGRRILDELGEVFLKKHGSPNQYGRRRSPGKW